MVGQAARAVARQEAGGAESRELKLQFVPAPSARTAGTGYRRTHASDSTGAHPRAYGQNRDTSAPLLAGHVLHCLLTCRFPVGKAGLEPAASTSRTWRATKLRYFPCAPVYRRPHRLVTALLG